MKNIKIFLLFVFLILITSFAFGQPSKGKDLAQAEKKGNLIPSDCLLRVFQDKSGIFFVHYSIEPKKISFLSYENKYSVNFTLNGMITDSKGNTVFQYEKTFPLELTQEQVEDVQKTSIALQDLVPLIAGDYKFQLLLKNTVSKEFTSFESAVSVPQDLSTLEISPLLLGYRLKKDFSSPDVNRPFKIGIDQIACQAENTFQAKENLIVFFQIYGLSKEVHESGILKITFFKEGKEFSTVRKNLGRLDPKNILEEFSLESFPAGHYEIQVSILDRSSREILSRKEEFEVSPLSSLPRPWIFSRSMPASHHIEYSFILGNQFANTGNFQEAKRLIEEAYDRNPFSPRYALSYGQLLMKMKQYRRAKEILLPFSENPEENYQFLSLLGYSCQSLGQYEEAILFYKKYLSQAETNLRILNSVGECYYRLGNIKEALAAWESSLELDPNQEEIKKIVKFLKSKS